MGREGFKEAYEKLEEQYAKVREQLAGLQLHNDDHEKPR
jgi:hypothetical protein